MGATEVFETAMPESIRSGLRSGASPPRDAVSWDGLGPPHSLYAPSRSWQDPGGAAPCRSVSPLRPARIKVLGPLAVSCVMEVPRGEAGRRRIGSSVVWGEGRRAVSGWEL